MKWTRRVAVILLVAGVVFGLRMIPSPPPAQADCGGIPVISQICSVLSGAWNIAVGVTGWQLKWDGKVVGFITSHAGQYACKLASGKLPIGGGIISSMCDKVISKLTGSKSSSSSSTPPTGGNGTSSSSSATAAAPPQGTPAAALSTAGMAALAGAATLFVAHNISADTHVQLTNGFFPSMYSTLESIAWELAAVALMFSVLLILGRAWAPDMLARLGATLVQIPKAALLMVAIPVVTAIAVGLIDALCAFFMGKFHGGVTLMHILAAALGVLAGGSAIAHLTGHATIAHITGSAAWFAALFGLLSSGAIALELILREIAIYMSLLIIPLALIGEIVTAFRGWAAGLGKLLFVVVISKFVLVIGLALAGALATSLSVIAFIVGIVTLLVLAFVPAVLYAGLIRVEQALHSHMSQGVLSPVSMAGVARSTHQRVRDRFARPESATS